VPFSPPRFIAIGSISDAMSGNGVEQLLIESRANHSIVAALHGDQRLKGFQRLDRALKADRARFKLMLGCGLRDNGPNQVVSQDVGPNLFAH